MVAAALMAVKLVVLAVLLCSKAIRLTAVVMPLARKCDGRV